MANAYTPRMRYLPLLLLSACSITGIPSQAFRGTPPAGLEAQALAVGADAPPLPGVLQPEVVVFYRGHW